MNTDQHPNIALLIVDDETDFRHQAVSFFKRLGFQVDQAEDGEEALNVSTNRKFDVVVLDIHMPEMSGITVLEQLMKQDPAPKVIMLTGGGTIEHAVESMKKGAYDFVTKPAKLEELQRLVVRASSAHKLEREKPPTKGRLATQHTQPSNDWAIRTNAGSYPLSRTNGQFRQTRVNSRRKRYWKRVSCESNSPSKPAVRQTSSRRQLRSPCGTAIWKVSCLGTKKVHSLEPSR